MNRRHFFKLATALPFVGVPVALTRTQREVQMLATARALATELCAISYGPAWEYVNFYRKEYERVFDAAEPEYQRALKDVS